MTVHFLGVGGYGMSGLAEVLAARGEHVTGCDLRQTTRTRRLAQRGVEVSIGHDVRHLDGCAELVYTTDAPLDHPEIAAAREHGVPVRHRSEILSELLHSAGQAVAVTGTHGKTTTSGLIAHVLMAAGLDPTAVVGGEVPGWGGGARVGQMKVVVAEADESDGSFLRYRPDVAVVTNVEPEHLEHYGGKFSHVIDAYRAFLCGLAPHAVAVLWAGDPVLRRVAQDVSAARIVWYGLSGDFEGHEGRTGAFVGKTSKVQPGEGAMEVAAGNRRLGNVRICLAGDHNLRNALAALAAADALGADLERAAASLPSYVNAARRMEVLWRGKDGAPRLVDDYAHHPTELRAVLAALRPQAVGRLWAVFQPHRYARTVSLWEGFRTAFADADRLVLTEIYAPAGEQPVAGVSSEQLAAAIAAPKWVRFCPTLAQAEQTVRQEAAETDLIVTLGAGNVRTVAEGLLADVGRTFA